MARFTLRGMHRGRPALLVYDDLEARRARTTLAPYYLDGTASARGHALAALAEPSVRLVPTGPTWEPPDVTDPLCALVAMMSVFDDPLEVEAEGDAPEAPVLPPGAIA